MLHVYFQDLSIQGVANFDRQIQRGASKPRGDDKTPQNKGSHARFSRWNEDIWILTDSRASIQHLSRWATVWDMTSLNILNVVLRLSSRHSIYVQCVPSHIGLNNNEIADSLVKSATADVL
ncbi:hypothetical protein TNCV_937791 [Trichonephila clavipes]|nr:hypothetical protein TNCV_937791 [Trichonephila clavipes]